MSRLSVAGFAALAVATAAAFFITQHLKVSTPLIAGFPAPVPAAIDPYGSRCGEVSHEVSRFSFYLLNSSDSVDVNIIDASGHVVRHLARNHPMRVKVRNPDGDFAWDGRDDAGRVVPDGSYQIQVILLHHHRTVTISSASGPEPIRVETMAPRPKVTAVTPGTVREPGARVTLTYAGNADRGGTVRIFRTDGRAGPRLVKSFLTPWRGQQAVWNTRIDFRPAPQGTYLLGLDVTDAACSTGHFPTRLPPPRGSTRGAGVTISYLSARPPLAGVAAGDGDPVKVDSSGAFRWSVRRAGSTFASGSGRGDTTIVPRVSGTGLFSLSLTSRLASVSVPLLVRPVEARAQTVLAVMPLLSWVGESPVDGDGDGIPDVLSAGYPARLDRPIVDGPPAGFAAAAGVLDAFSALGDAPDPVADLALAGELDAPGARAAGLLLPGGETWLPEGLGRRLAAWVRGGGRLLSFGTGTLLRTARIARGVAIPLPGAGDRDPFGIPARAACTSIPCVIDRRVGRGRVIEVRSGLAGLPSGRGRALLRRWWTVLTRGR